MMEDGGLKSYPIDDDIKKMHAEIKRSKNGQDESFNPHFDPKKFKESHAELKTKDFILSETELEKFALIAADLRARVRERASEIAGPESGKSMRSNIFKLAEKTLRDRSPRRRRSRILRIKPEFIPEKGADLQIKKKRHMCELTTKEKTAIIHEVLV
jgi:hypothetical protein